MAVFQQLGASGYDDEEAKRIMDVLNGVKNFANENDDSKIILQDNKRDGAPNIMIGEDDGLIHNKVVLNNDELIYMAGGNGGDPLAALDEVQNETMATKKSTNR